MLIYSAKLRFHVARLLPVLKINLGWCLQISTMQSQSKHISLKYSPFFIAVFQESSPDLHKGFGS